MSNINRSILVGRLTKQPELRITPNSASVTTFTIAVDRRPGKSGNKETDFIDIVAFSSTAEAICKYLDKGSLVGVDGRIQTRSYDTKDGQRRKVFEIIADNVQFLSRKKEQEDAFEDE
jgi:single-strand DNA-binding protein